MSYYVNLTYIIVMHKATKTLTMITIKLTFYTYAVSCNKQYMNI